MKYKYKFKFYLNRRYYVYTNDNNQEFWAHTWELVIYIENLLEEIIIFGELEKTIKDYLLKFEGKIFNDIDELKKKNILLLKIELSENPTRTFIIEE